MANQTNVYYKLRLRNYNESVEIDFSDSEFEDFRNKLCSISYAEKGTFVKGGFHTYGRWGLINNFEESEENLKEAVSYLIKILKSKKISATHLIGDFCDFDSSLDQCLLGYFVINIDNSYDNKDLYKLIFNNEVQSISRYGKEVLKLESQYEDENEVEELDILNEYEFDILEAFNEEVNKRNRLNDDIDEVMEYKKIDKKRLEDLNENDLSLKTLFNPEFIINHLTLKTEFSKKVLENNKILFDKHVHHPDFGWDLPSYHIIRIMFYNHRLDLPEGKLLGHYFSAVLGVLADYCNLLAKNYREENILFCLLDFPVYYNDVDRKGNIVYEPYIEQLVAIVDALKHIKVNPIEKNCANQSFYDLLCRNHSAYYKVIRLIENSSYFDDVKNKNKIFFEHQDPKPKDFYDILGKLDARDFTDIVKHVKKAKKINILVENNLSLPVIAAIFNIKDLKEYFLNLNYDLNHSTSVATESNSTVATKRGLSLISNKNMMMLSIIFDDFEFAMKLVDKGWDANYVSDGFETPLQIAIENQNLSLIKFFIYRGANFEFNEIRHNLGLSDIFTISAQKNKVYNKEFWEYVTENKLYKNYPDEYGNTLIFYTSNEDINYRNEVMLNLDKKFKDKEWLEYVENPSADQVSEIFKLLSKDLEKAKKYIIKNKINLNTKIVLNKPTIRVSRVNVDEGPSFYAIPLLVYWVSSNLTTFSKDEVEEFKKVFKNFSELGFDVNTTDSQISKFFNFNSVGNRNVLLTILDKIKLLSEENRVNAFNLVEFMLQNGSNMNSLDKNHNSVLEYLSDLHDCELAVSLYNELVIKGAKTGYEQLCYVGLPILHKIQIKNNSKYNISLLTEDKLIKPLVLRNDISTSIECKYKLYTPKLLNDVQEEILDLISENKDDELLKRIKNGADVSFCFDHNVNVLIFSIVFRNIKSAIYLINDGFPIYEKTSFDLTGEDVLDNQLKPGFTALSLAEIIKNQEVIELIKQKMKIK